MLIFGVRKKRYLIFRVPQFLSFWFIMFIVVGLTFGILYRLFGNFTEPFRRFGCLTGIFARGSLIVVIEAMQSG